jgi:5-methyltetrahydrofolate corrinoid/iron sulfur protein methyltransferase
MQIIGEKINGTRKGVETAIANRDEAFIKHLAKEQVEAGADLLDINAGTTPDREPDDLAWLVRIVQGVVEVPLCLDSANPIALTEALKYIRHESMINSINGDPERLKNILPIVIKHNCMVIAMALDESKIPKSVDDRLNVVKKIFNSTRGAGIPDEKVYIDPLVMTIGTDIKAGLTALEAMRVIKRIFPKSHITCGLSNISFGLPGRSLINRTFLTLAMEVGLDSAILDPTDQQLRESLLATELLLGKDQFCRKYTQAFRSKVIRNGRKGKGR